MGLVDNQPSCFLDLYRNPALGIAGAGFPEK